MAHATDLVESLQAPSQILQSCDKPNVPFYPQGFKANPGLELANAFSVLRFSCIQRSEIFLQTNACVKYCRDMNRRNEDEMPRRFRRKLPERGKISKLFRKLKGGHPHVAQSLSGLWTHLIFSTKNRFPFLSETTIRTDMHAYLAKMLRDQDCETLIVNGVEDRWSVLTA